MLRKYFNIALRIIRQNWSFTLLNIIGIAIGLATYFLIMLWVNDELNYDKFNRNYPNLYRIVENQYYTGGEVFPVAVTPGPLAEGIKRDFPDVKKSSRLTTRWFVVRHGEKIINEEFSVVDPDILEMFSIELISGDKSGSLRNIRSVILTEDLSKKYFGNENPVGKSINIDKKEFMVTGVMKNFPKNSHYQFKSLMPFENLKEKDSYIGQWGSNSYWTYVMLTPNIDIEKFNEKIKRLIIKNTNVTNKTEIYAQHIGEIHLYSSGKFTAEIGNQGDIVYVRALRIIAIFILLIACINFMNLSTAQSARRAKEVGIKKISGAGRQKLVLQFLGESVLLVLLAYVVAMVIVESLLSSFSNLTGKNLQLEYFSWEHLRNSLGIILVTGIVAGSYPAFFLSSFDPLKVLKGKFTSGSGAAIFRRYLVTGQFIISIALIISTLVITRQLNYIQNKKLGYDHENVVYLYLNDDIKAHSQSFKQEITSNSMIESISFTNHNPSQIGSSSWGWDWEGKPKDEEVLMHVNMVDKDFQKTLKLQMSDGEFFTSDDGKDSSVVLNETAAKLISTRESVVGKVIGFNGKKLHVIGVIRDFHFKSVHRKIEPLIMGVLPDQFSIALIRVAAGNKEKAYKHIEEVFKKYASDQPYYLGFLDEDLNNQYLSEKRMATIFRYFSVLAILISCLGLFGLSLFTAEQKTKEIGIRKTLGATSLSVIVLFLKQYFRWVAIATIISIPIAWYGMHSWLENFAYRIRLSPVEFVAAALLAFTIAMLTVSYQAIKAAGQNPVISLKYE